MTKAAKARKDPAKDKADETRSNDRNARIQQIRLAIEDGSYQVDALAVSKAIVRRAIVRKISD